MRTLFALALFTLSANVMAADINGDGAVDRADLDVMRAAFYGYDARADLNRDGKVNFTDLALLKGAMSGGSAAAVPLVAPNITLLPATQDVGRNGTLVLEMYMDFTEEPTLGGGIDITFDPAVLNFVSFVFDPALGDDPDFRRQPNLEAPGVLNALAFGSFFGLTGPSLVGTFTFSVNAVLGLTPITIAADQPDGIAGPFVSLITFLPMNVVFNSAQANVRGPEITVTPSPVNLGSVRQGQTEQVAVTVTNSGLATLMTGVVGNTDPIAAPFSITNNTCNNRNLAPAATCTLNVRLAGSGNPGPRNDSFNIPSNATNNANLIVPVTGNVVQRVGVNPIQGITTTTARCTNQNTGLFVDINLAGATQLNCETAGLVIAPGATVIVQINGTRIAGATVGGTVRSMGLTLVQCQNLTTGQSRNFDPAPPGPNPRNWNCLGGNPPWSAAVGNSVRMTVRGAAD